MSRPDPLRVTLRDFDTLSAKDQRLVLAELSADERRSIKQLQQTLDDGNSSPIPHSPWFEQLTTAVRQGEGDLAPLARETFLTTFGSEDRKQSAVAKPSLLQVAGTALRQSRGRR